MTLREFCHLVLGAALLPLFVYASAQSPAPSQPEGVSLLLSLKGGSRQFHVGEVIPLRLAFSSSVPGRYSVDMASYDRSGRMTSEEFHLEPHDGWSDPLTDYFDSGLFSFMGGGLRGIPELGTEPKTMDLDLNEWVRFERPGHYRLSVSSSRVQPKNRDSSGERFTIASNEVEFEIVPIDNEWAQQQVARSLAAFSSTDQDAASHAARTLRFLGTENAVSAMVEKFRGDEGGCDLDYMFGLIGSSSRAFVVHEMEAALDGHDHPISPMFVRTLAVLAYRLDHPEPFPSPPLLALGQDNTAWEQWRQQSKQREDSLKPYLRRYLGRLRDSLNHKTDRAFAEGLISIMIEGTESGVLEDPEFGEFFTQTRDRMPALFLQLPKGSQESLLSFWWEQIRSSEMAPVLRKLYDTTPSFQRGEYLRLINDLDHKQARDLVLEDMQRPNPTLLYDEIHILGNEALPAIDHVLARRLDEAEKSQATSFPIFAMLIERHATVQVLPEIEAVYQRFGESGDCAARANLVAYFLRVDFKYGKQELNRINWDAKGGTPGCGGLALGIALDRQPSVALEQLAKSRLWNTDPRIATDAAETLRESGSPGSEKSIWKRLQEWHKEFVARSESLDTPDNKTQLRLGSALLKAIAQGTGWIANADKLTELKEYCVSKEQCSEIDGYSERWKRGPELEIIVFNHETVWPHLAQYELRSLDQLWPKLAEFPRGTTITYSPQFQPEEKAHAQRIYTQLIRFAEDHGLQIEKSAR